MPDNEFIDFAYREEIQDQKLEGLRPGSAEWEPVESTLRESVWTAFRSEALTPAGEELPPGSLCREYVLVNDVWSDPTPATPCQTEATPVPEPGLLGLLAGVLLLHVLRKNR